MHGNDELTLRDRVYCKECGKRRIKVDFPYALCPEGHGKLTARHSVADVSKLRVESYPEATQVGHHKRRRRFTITGYQEYYVYALSNTTSDTTEAAKIKPSQVKVRIGRRSCSGSTYFVLRILDHIDKRQL